MFDSGNDIQVSFIYGDSEETRKNIDKILDDPELEFSEKSKLIREIINPRS